MNLNCRPGDLARVISCPDTIECGVADWFITMTSINGCTWLGQPVWGYEGPWRVVPKGPGQGMSITGFADHILRPIRDPGDDAVDEMLLKYQVLTEEPVR